MTGIGKFRKPSTKHVLTRKRLFDLIDSHSDSQVLWISGPSGIGKTSLVSSYIDHKKKPCLWHNIDKRDCDLSTFLFYLTANMRERLNRSTGLSSLMSRYSDDMQAYVLYYFEHFYSLLKKPSFIVFDDYHILADCEINMLLSHVFSMMSNHRMIIISRTRIYPEYMHLFTKGTIKCVDVDDLYFDHGETSRVILKITKKYISKDIVDDIYKYTQGWIMAIVLLSEKLKKIDNHNDFNIDIAKDNIYDYISSTVLESVDGSMQEILVQMSFLPEMTEEMIRMLVDGDPSDIIHFMRRNYFCSVRNIRSKIVYRYHILFKGFLKQRANMLLADKRQEIMYKAAVVLEGYGYIEDSAGVYIK